MTIEVEVKYIIIIIILLSNKHPYMFVTRKKKKNKIMNGNSFGHFSGVMGFTAASNNISVILLWNIF